MRNRKNLNNNFTMWLKLAQLVGLFMFLYSSFYPSKDDDKKFYFLLVFMYIEKLFAEIFKYLDIVTKSKKQDPLHEISDLTDENKLFRNVLLAILSSKNINKNTFNEDMHEMATQIEQHYSPITRASLIATSVFPSILMKGFPAPCKQVAKTITKQLTMTRNELIIDALKNGQCAKNIHLQFEYLIDNNASYKEVSRLIKAIKRGNAPYGLSIKISHHKSSFFKQSKLEIDELLRTNDLKHAALSCVTLQQGKRDDNSIVSALPQETLNQIYSYAYPSTSTAEKKQIKAFINNVTTYPVSSFFKSNSKGRANTNDTSMNNDEIIPDQKP